ncbi:hypothetical protein JHK82_013431 [Glycine max]|nr:hypothetical protein JHK85_013797 [Glycine max]KAG5155462.1 hypothetical protein JHK82_013431 [Glycine max]
MCTSLCSTGPTFSLFPIIPCHVYHYFTMWPALIAKAKEGGLDVIQTYVFWNLHEPQHGRIDNEYQYVEKAFGEEGSQYVEWAAKMEVGLKTGVPWVMCKQTDVPDPLINACNGMRCGETFTGPNSPNKSNFA